MFVVGFMILFVKLEGDENISCGICSWFRGVFYLVVSVCVEIYDFFLFLSL